MNDKEDNTIFSVSAFSTAFSHPVLMEGKKDYTDKCMLSFDVNQSIDENDFIFNVSYKLSSGDLQRYIDMGVVIAAVTIDCDRTAYRCLCSFPQDKNTMRIKINFNDLFADVKIKCILLAAVDIDNFSCLNDWNSDTISTGSVFFVKKASILASSHERIFNINEEFEDGDTTSSIADIIMDCSNENLFDAIYEKQEIKIYLGEKLYKTYFELGKRYPDNSLTCFVMPVFVEALDLLRDKEKYTEYAGYYWAEVLLKKIKDIYGKEIHDINLSSSGIINTVFSNIALRSGKNILKIGQDQYEE